MRYGYKAPRTSIEANNKTLHPIPDPPQVESVMNDPTLNLELGARPRQHLDVLPER